MFVEALGGPHGAREAFHKLEHALPSLKGRRFYGLISENGQKYLSCVALTSEDEARGLKFPTTTVPAGPYVRQKIKNWESQVGSIADFFHHLAESYVEDESRPRVEFYRSQTELILLLPVKS